MSTVSNEAREVGRAAKFFCRKEVAKLCTPRLVTGVIPVDARMIAEESLQKKISLCAGLQ